MKPNKSILKRIRITGTGKLIRRRARVNHFNAKASRKVQRRQGQSVSVTGSFGKAIRKYI